MVGSKTIWFSEVLSRWPFIDSVSATWINSVSATWTQQDYPSIKTMRAT